MTQVFAAYALLPEGWARDVAVTIATDGTIAAVRTGIPDKSGACRILLPAPGNLHSHTFQRAMAGRTEHRGASRDSFWTWRELMYRFLEHLTPDDIEAIATLAFMEMQEAGFAAVAEFHYLHHAPGGTPYADLAETSVRIVAAAAATGIGLTLLPVLYCYGGARGAPLAGGQKRFGNNLDRFARLLDGARSAAAALPPDTCLGIAPHSLRAVTPDMLLALVETAPEGPIHMHIAEQPREVADIEAWLGARPVAWLLDAVPVDARWCLIHATHMTPEETFDLARCGAVAGLCPVTESNLGDGIFDGCRFIAAGGSLGIGSDSNVAIDLVAEIRTLEYSQRLRDRERNVLLANSGSVGETLYARVSAGGAQALGRNAGAIKVGLFADLVGLDADHLAFVGLPPERWLDAWIFAAGPGVLRDLWSAGRHSVRDGRHVARDTIVARYRATLVALATRI